MLRMRNDSLRVGGRPHSREVTGMLPGCQLAADLGPSAPLPRLLYEAPDSLLMTPSSKLKLRLIPPILRLYTATDPTG